MRSVFTILVAALLACGFVASASAQDGARFGMGVELQNQPATALMSMVWEGDSDIMQPGIYLTPTVLFTIQVTPAVFIEPSIGYHRMSYSEEYKGDETFEDKKNEWSGQDLMFGVGMIYALKPDATVSPMLHPMLAVHLLSGSEETTPPTGSSYKYENSATAFAVGLGIGGLINLKETVYLTAEARLMYTSVGDIDESRDPADGFTDDYDTSASAFDTDMAVGIRFVF